MTPSLLHLMTMIHHGGWIGCLLLILLYAFCCLTLLPGSLLTLGAGAIYGLFFGSTLISLGSLLGATLSFLASRYLCRGWLEKRLAHNKKFLQLDAAVAEEGWKIVILTRLSPLFPFSLVNYGLGLTRISLGQFMLASWLDTMPLIGVYVYAGHLMGSLAKLNSEHQPAGLWILQVGGLVATVVLSIFITRLATKALKNKIKDE